MSYSSDDILEEHPADWIVAKLRAENERFRATLTEIAKDDPSGKWGRWARESLSHEQSQQSKENGS